MLRIAGQKIDPRLVVFDKDGTLVAFEPVWRTRFARLIEVLEDLASLTPETRLGLAGTLGYDAETGEWDPQGPLTIASNAEIDLLMAGQLYRYQGLNWDEALAIIARAEEIALTDLCLIDLVQPIGDVETTLRGLRAGGLVLALATTDDRESTKQALDKLGVLDLFATMVCGDEGIPLKPAPDMAQEICRRVGIAPREAIMVGDTVADMTMARRAGFGCAIGVTSGPLSRRALALHADLVIADIHAIEIVPPGEDKRQ